MKVVFLLSRVQEERGLFHATGRVAAALGQDHDVQIWVVRDQQDPGWRTDASLSVRTLISVEDDGEAAAEELQVAAADAGLLAATRSRLVPDDWEGGFSALTDLVLQRALTALDVDVLVSTSPGTLAAAVSWCPPSTSLVHHERFRARLRPKSLEALRVLGPRLDAVVAGDEVTAHHLEDTVGPGGPRVVTLPDPVAGDLLPHSRGTTRIVVAAGAFTSENRLGHVIKAFGAAADQLPGWRLRIFGHGRLRQELAATARKAQLFDRVEFPGLSADMATEWARAGIGVVTARGSSPLVAAEAMAAALPVVAHNHPGGCSQLIEHEHNGLLVSPSSLRSLSGALVRLAGDSDLRCRLGAAAVESTSHLTPRSVGARWEALLEEARQSRQTGPSGSRTSRTRSVWAVCETHEGQHHDLDLAPEVARRGLLELLTRTASSVSSEWFVLRPIRDRAPVVVLPVSARRDFLVRLTEEGPALEVLPAADSIAGQPRGWLRALGEVLVRSQPSVVQLSGPREVGGRATLASHGAQVDVEFWEEVGDSLLPPRSNEWVNEWRRDEPTRGTEIAGLDLPTIPLAAEPTLDDLAFPIDAVYTWVDGDDPAWQKRRDARMAGVEGLSLTRAASGRARFVSRDELRYSMRSLRLFAPWVRHIYLVTDHQVPDWLDPESSDVTVVSHAEILSPEHLPTFNSHAIETGLHRVPSLSDHFIYFNDDVMLGRPVRPDQFFNAAGQFAAFVGDQILGEDSSDALPWRRAGLNNRELLRQHFGRTITRTVRHTPHPFNRQALLDIEQRFPDELARTAAAPFRSSTDISLASSFAQHFGLLTGTAYRGDLDTQFVAITDARLETVLSNLLKTRAPHVVCLADHHDWALPEARAQALVHEFLEAYYPVAAPWEIDRST